MASSSLGYSRHHIWTDTRKRVLAMPSEGKVALGCLSCALDDVYTAYKADVAMHKRKLDTQRRALSSLKNALDIAETCSGGLDFRSCLAAIAGLAVRAMVDLE